MRKWSIIVIGTLALKSMLANPRAFASLAMPSGTPVPSGTVSQLPVCNGVSPGVAIVTDSTSSCAAGAVLSGGGENSCFVGCNGTNWVLLGTAITPSSISLTAPRDFNVSGSPSAALTLSHSGQICSAASCSVTSGFVIANASSNNLAVDLPASNATFNPVDVCKTDSSSNTVTVTPNGTDTINGASSFVLSKQFQCVDVVDSTVGNWTVKHVAYPVAQTAPTNKFMTGLSTSGVASFAQPASTNLSDLPIPVSSGGTQCGAPTTYANLPASPTNGEICNVTDATACTLGTSVSAGGGSTKCQVTYNGSNWMPGGGAASPASGGFTSAGTGLAGSGSTVSLTTPVTVANGGTQCGAPVTYASLPGSPTNGEICNVTDATACTLGTAVSAGGGSTKCQVTYNGSNWMPGGGAASSASGSFSTAGTGLTGSGSTVSLTTPVTVASGGTQCGAPTTYSSLPGSPTNGEVCNITDANICEVGAAVSAGGGSTKCQITYNGSSWYPSGGATNGTTGGPIRIGAPISSTPTTGQIYPTMMTDTVKWPANFAATAPDPVSKAGCLTNPSEVDAYQFECGTTYFGSVVINTSGSATFATGTRPFVRGESSPSINSTNGWTLATPTSTVSGDLLVLVVLHANIGCESAGSITTSGGGTWSAPTGGTYSGSGNQYGCVYTRIATSGDAAGAASYTYSATGSYAVGAMVDVANGANSTNFDVAPVWNSTGTPGTSPQISSINGLSTSQDLYLGSIMLTCCGSGTITGPRTLIPVASTPENNNYNYGGYIGQLPLTTTSQGALTGSFSASNTWTTVALAIAPATNGGTASCAAGSVAEIIAPDYAITGICPITLAGHSS
jgi:hypothetical protein